MSNLSPRALALSQAHGPGPVDWERMVRVVEISNGAALQTRIAELEMLINTPTISDWFDGVRMESAHQHERWGSEHDAGKAPLDWFWLIGYLAQKAATSAMIGDVDKAKHHTISTAAALLNWHRAISGESYAMRPGIAPPADREKTEGEAGV